MLSIPLLYPSFVFQPSTAIGPRGHRGRRAGPTAVITGPGPARLRVRRTADVTARAEIRCPAIVPEDLVSVNNTHTIVHVSQVIPMFA